MLSILGGMPISDGMNTIGEFGRISDSIRALGSRGASYCTYEGQDGIERALDLACQLSLPII